MERPEQRAARRSTSRGRGAGDALWFGCLLGLVTGAGCFTGSFLLGEPCVTDRDCGPTLSCIEGVCGGPTSAGPETETEATTTATETSGPGTSTTETTGETQTGTTDLEPCGNGRVDDGEECDDGNENNNDDCLDTCVAASCGDGYVHLNVEACDDGNNEDGDACEDACMTAHTANAIAVGGRHTCAVVDRSGLMGGVRCWGDNLAGQLGLGVASIDALGDDEHPADHFVDDGKVELGGENAVSWVVAGDAHTCALMGDDTVRCWGAGQFGRLGYGNTDTIGDNETPAEYYASVLGTEGSVPIFGGMSPIATITAGAEHTCALEEIDGRVRCWGRNQYGQLGTGAAQDIGDDEFPADAGDVDLGVVVIDGDPPEVKPARAVQIDAGKYHTCAVIQTGAVRCWGRNDFGQLGYGDPTILTIGRDAPPSETYALLPDGGDIAFLRPEESANSVRVTAGEQHTCVRLDTNAVRCWGGNKYGQLGYGEPESFPEGELEQVGDNETPIAYYDSLVKQEHAGRLGDVELVVNGGPSIVQVSAGDRHTCVRLGNSRVHCWGYGTYGQLGYGVEDNIGDFQTPLAYYIDVGNLGDPHVQVGGNAVGLAVGGYHNCALLTGGRVRCWGQGTNGRLGYAETGFIGNSQRPIDYYENVLGVSGDVQIF